MSAISVVVPVYNARPWLPRFVASLQNQTFKDFEVLLVDDASTDESAAFAEGVASVDPRFRLFRLPQNSGCGVARNLGIREAQGETICFADPDDLLPDNSLEVRYAAYKKHGAIVRACHDEVLDDGTIHNHEVRPQAVPEICIPAHDSLRIGVNPFLCAHWTWLLPTNLLRRNNIFYPEGMRTAEDIIMLTRLFFHVNRLVWIPDTVYYWMKRTDSLSNTIYTAEHYKNYFDCCETFYDEAKQHDKIRLADIFFNNYLKIYLKHLLWQAHTGRIDENGMQEAVGAMARTGFRHKVFPRCTQEMERFPQRCEGLWRLWHIQGNKNPSMYFRLVESQNHVLQLLRNAEYEEIRRKGWNHQVSFDKYDADQRLLRARYVFCDTPPEEKYCCEDTQLAPAYDKNRQIFDGKDFSILERILWLPLPENAEDRLTFDVGGRDAGLNHTAEQIQTAFAPKPLADRTFPPDIQALRHLTRSQAIRDKFLNSWMFIDKDTEADDNAEHVYRWVMRNHPEVNAWFVLNEDSHDWERLKADGFKLVPHGGIEHKALFLLCAKLISSQMDRYIFEPLEEAYFSDYTRPQFTCLPHGVTKDDVSDWFNSIPFDLFIAATRDEVASIVADGTAYVMTEKEVRLSGFPRYDKWLEPVEKENIIFVMPTWRSDLVGEWDGKGQKRKKNPNFASSRFVKMWKEVFEDNQFQELLGRHGYRIVFFAHPCFEDYLDELDFPDFVEKRSKQHGSIVEIMQKSKVMITDFSSVAYDMAYMRRPVIYYQYEDKSEFVRSQKWVSGYIDYEEMGFGPVCRNRASLVQALEEAFQADGNMPAKYVQRAEQTFAYHDAQCCQRAYEFIVNASEPSM